MIILYIPNKSNTHKNKPDATGEVCTQSGATQTEPTFSRLDLGADLLYYYTIRKRGRKTARRLQSERGDSPDGGNLSGGSLVCPFKPPPKAARRANTPDTRVFLQKTPLMLDAKSPSLNARNDSVASFVDKELPCAAHRQQTVYYPKIAPLLPTVILLAKTIQPQRVLVKD